MLSNSAFAGLLAAAYLTLLLLLLNPAVPLGAAGQVAAVVVVSYGVHIGVVCYALYSIRQAVLREPSPPGWVSLRLLTWTAAVLGGTAAVLTWLHATGLGRTLDEVSILALERLSLSFGAATLAFLALAVAQALAYGLQRATVAVLFTLATMTSLLVPVVQRSLLDPGLAAPSRPGNPAAVAPAPADERRVIVLCLDGASLDVISPAVAEGRLPNLGRMLDRGASLYLETSRPTQPEPVWASAMTGMWPARHGVRGSSRYRPFNGTVQLEVLPDYIFSQALVRFGLLIEDPYSSGSLQAQPVWQIANRYQVRTGLVGLPLTHPATEVEGFVVSDRFSRRTDREAVLEDAPAVSPSRLDGLARQVLAEARGAEEPPLYLDLLPRTEGSASSVDADQLHHRLASALAAAEPVRLLIVRYAGLDAVGHYYLRFARPEAFGDVSDEERRAFGRVLDDYYARLDAWVGEALGALGDGDVLLVVSGFGMEPLTVGKRLLERAVGDERFSGTHERGPDGFLLAYGTPVAAGRPPRGAVVDVAPTLLYLMGVPVARDMDGFARTDLFTPAFNEQRTITVIPTHGAP